MQAVCVVAALALAYWALGPIFFGVILAAIVIGLVMVGIGAHLIDQTAVVVLVGDVGPPARDLIRNGNVSLSCIW